MWLSLSVPCPFTLSPTFLFPYVFSLLFWLNSKASLAILVLTLCPFVLVTSSAPWFHSCFSTRLSFPVPIPVLISLFQIQCLANYGSRMTYTSLPEQTQLDPLPLFLTSVSGFVIIGCYLQPRFTLHLTSHLVCDLSLLSLPGFLSTSDCFRVQCSPQASIFDLLSPHLFLLLDGDGEGWGLTRDWLRFSHLLTKGFTSDLMLLRSKLNIVLTC